MTIDEAKTKWCPYRGVETSVSCAGLDANDDPAEQTAGWLKRSRCLADACALWAAETLDGNGHCGLIHR